MFYEEFLSKYQQFDLEVKQFPFIKCKGKVSLTDCSNFRDIRGTFTPEKPLKNYINEAIGEAVEAFLNKIHLEDACRIILEVQNYDGVYDKVFISYSPSFESKYDNMFFNQNYLFLANLLYNHNNNFRFKIRHNIDNLPEDIYNKKDIKVSLCDDEGNEFIYFDMMYLDDRKYADSVNFLTCCTVNSETDPELQKVPIMCRDVIDIIQELHKTDLEEKYSKDIDSLCNLFSESTRFKR